jgi:hypothetical protein
MASKKNGVMSRAARTKLLGKFPLSDLEDSEGKLPASPRRIAHFLDYWAKVAPYDFAGYNEVLYAIEQRRSMPRLDTKDVWALRQRVYAGKKILRSEYNRDTVSSKGLGVRASVDDEDVLRNVAPRQTVAVERSIRRLAEVDAMIDPKKVKDTAENKALKQWYSRNVRGILKQIASPEFTDKLLPPKPEE